MTMSARSLPGLTLSLAALRAVRTTTRSSTEFEMNVSGRIAVRV